MIRVLDTIFSSTFLKISSALGCVFFTNKKLGNKNIRIKEIKTENGKLLGEIS